MSHESDKQNQMIMERLAQTQLAVNVLHANGLSVMDINRIGSHPVIKIYRGPGCIHLKGAWKRRIIVDHVKCYEWVADISGCKVVWEEKD